MSFLWHGLTEQGAQVPVQVDAQGRVIAVDGTPGVSNWDRTNGVLSPAVPTDSVDIGSSNISLNANGTSTFEGLLAVNEAVRSNRTGSTQACFSARLNGNQNAIIQADGSAGFAGQIWSAVNGQLPSSGNDYKGVRINNNNNGNIALYGGDIRIWDQVGGTGNFSKTNVQISQTGSATFEGTIQAGGDANAGIAGTKIFSEGSITVCRNATDVAFSTKAAGSTTSKTTILANGSATFAGNVTAPNITFRSADPQFYVKKSKSKDASPDYVGPELDLLAEIARLEALVRHLYETLRIAPPAGWPVWDGNDEVLRQLRK